MICCLKRTDIDEKSGMACIASSEGGGLYAYAWWERRPNCVFEKEKNSLSRLCRIIKKNK